MHVTNHCTQELVVKTRGYLNNVYIVEQSHNKDNLQHVAGHALSQAEEGNVFQQGVSQ